MHTQRADVGARLATHPEHAQLVLWIVLDQLALVDRADTQLTLHGCDQRRTLEQGARQLLQRLLQSHLALDRVVETHDRNVLLTRSLLALHQTGRTVDANDQTARHLRIQRATVTRTLAVQNSLHPSDYFVRRGIRRLIQIDATIPTPRHPSAYPTKYTP